MKIALIGSKGIPTRSGGVERHVEELAIRFARLGHNTTVYGRKSYGIPKKSIFKGVRILAMPSISTKNLDAITATFLGTIHILFSRYDVVHYHGIGPGSLLWIIRLFRPDMKVVSTFHSPDYNHKKWGVFARWYFHFGEWVSCHIAHKIIAVSQSLTLYVHKHHKKRAVYIPNGCAVTPSKQQDVLEKFGLTQKKYILVVSRLVRHKGIHFLIEAFSDLHNSDIRYKEYKLVIVGDSSYTDDYVKELWKLSSKNSSIIFTGEQRGEDLRQLFSHAYLFAQPSLSEGLSIALLEAMGYGIAPLVSDIPENTEAVFGCGLVFKNGCVESLKQVLKDALDNPKKVYEKAKHSQERAQKEYHWDMIACKTLDLYGTLFPLEIKQHPFLRTSVKHTL
jgi:glycosyltransferase involved in cell wall biosynthesis